MRAEPRLMAEWERHGATMLAWPHPQTDWEPMLEDVAACYRAIVDALLAAGHKIVVIAPAEYLPEFDSPEVATVSVDTNDTWIRDYGPLTLSDDTLLDFRFNAWGQKFPSNFDNQTTCQLCRLGALTARVEDHSDFVLEGGSIESDGCGTILTTACCLLAPNRNEPMGREEVERELLKRLRARKILWLDNLEPLPGDDTDGHVDTICRLAPNNTIIYTALPGLEQQLSQLTNADGEKFNLVELPLPDPIFDPEEGTQLPATYANYLVADNAVIMPTYGQPLGDQQARQALARAFSPRQIIGVDCRALIRQHGSLHCATMQVRPEAFSLFTDQK